MFIVRLLHSVDIFPVKCFLGNLKFKLEVSFKGIKVQEIKRRTARFKITSRAASSFERKQRCRLLILPVDVEVVQDLTGYCRTYFIYKHVPCWAVTSTSKLWRDQRSKSSRNNSSIIHCVTVRSIGNHCCTAVNWSIAQRLWSQIVQLQKKSL